MCNIEFIIKVDIDSYCSSNPLVQNAEHTKMCCRLRDTVILYANKTPRVTFPDRIKFAHALAMF